MGVDWAKAGDELMRPDGVVETTNWLVSDWAKFNSPVFRREVLAAAKDYVRGGRFRPYQPWGDASAWSDWAKVAGESV